MVETEYMASGSPGRINTMSNSVKDQSVDSEASDAHAKLELIRRRTGRSERDFAINGVLSGIRREASRPRKSSRSFIDAWEAVVPAKFASGTRVRSITGGVARVGVKSSALGFELDRALRGGLLASLREAYGGVLRRVRVEQDSALAR